MIYFRMLLITDCIYLMYFFLMTIQTYNLVLEFKFYNFTFSLYTVTLNFKFDELNAVYPCIVFI